MKILCQKNIWQEAGYDRLLESFKKLGALVIEVDLIPFSEKLEYDPLIKYDLVLGSTRFIDLAREAGLPVFTSFNRPIEPDFHRSHWINSDGIAMKWGNVNIGQPTFVKPFREKFFTGRVIEDNADKEKVQLTTSNVSDENEEVVWLSRPKKILEEYRFFVINRKLVTGSLYKNGEHRIQKRIDCSHDAWKFALDLINKGGVFPDRSFVMDIGLVVRPENQDSIYAIVELNNFNSSGIYDCDTDAIAQAILKPKYERWVDKDGNVAVVNIDALNRVKFNI